MRARSDLTLAINFTVTSYQSMGNPASVAKQSKLPAPQRSLMEGRVAFGSAGCDGSAIAKLAEFLNDGRMKSEQDVVVGIETLPETLLKLFNGENFGKLVLQVAEE
jgi:NADPH-dependent curcumin reductase CurA